MDWGLGLALFGVYCLVAAIATLFIMDPSSFEKDKAKGTLVFALLLGWLVVPARLISKAL